MTQQEEVYNWICKTFEGKNREKAIFMSAYNTCYHIDPIYNLHDNFGGSQNDYFIFSCGNCCSISDKILNNLQSDYSFLPLTEFLSVWIKDIPGWLVRVTNKMIEGFDRTSERATIIFGVDPYGNINGVLIDLDNFNYGFSQNNKLQKYIQLKIQEYIDQNLFCYWKNWIESLKTFITVEIKPTNDKNYVLIFVHLIIPYKYIIRKIELKDQIYNDSLDIYLINDNKLNN